MNLNHLSKAFSAAAFNYDLLAHGEQSGTLQSQAQALLLRTLNDIDATTFETVLDVGCGPGSCARALGQRGRDLVGIDIAQNMILEAKHSFPEHQWLNSDMHALPFNDNQFELVFSNLAFQWTHDTKALLSEMLRALKPGGRLVFSTLLHGSLPEFEMLYQQGLVRGINRYPHAEYWLGNLKEIGFDVINHRDETVKTIFDSPSKLIRSIKDIGASSFKEPPMTSGLKGRRWYQNFMNALAKESVVEQCAGTNHYSLTYRAGVFVACKPHLSRVDIK